MKRLLILPILSLLGATAFCTGLFSQTDRTESILEPVNDLVYKITEANSTDDSSHTDILYSDDSPEAEDTVTTYDKNQSVLIEQGDIIFTRRPAMLVGTTDAPLTTEIPETEAPVTTTKAPETTKAPTTTKKPETTKAPTTTKKPETTKAPETADTPTSTKNQASKIASIAKNEIGTKESGSNNIKYNTWFYGRKVSGSSYPWCAVFISWCGNQAGISTGILPHYTSASQYKEHYADLGRYYKYSSGYTPKVGDLVFIDWGGRHGSIDHVGIVVESKNGYIVTVEGNYSDKVSTNKYSLTSGKIVGYASPKYK